MPFEMMSLDQKEQQSKELLVVIEDTEEISRVSLSKVLMSQLESSAVRWWTHS